MMDHMVRDLLSKYNPFFPIDEAVLRAKLARPIPLWMKEQIEEDFHFFKSSPLSRDKVDRTFSKALETEYGRHAHLFKFVIRKNRLISPTLREAYKVPRIFKMVFFFRQMLKRMVLPEVEFLFSANDLYEDVSLQQHQEVPIFLISKRAGNPWFSLFPHVEWLSHWSSLRKRLKKQPLDWKQRKEILFWRGSSTGIGFPGMVDTRLKVAQLSHQLPHEIDACFTNFVQVEEALISDLQRKGLKQPPLSPEQQVCYKYLLALDGNCFAGSFFWQLSSGSVIFKNESPFLEWYYRGLKPLVHYVPFSAEATDLLERKRWAQEHDALAKDIATHALEFAENFLSIEDMMVYVYHLLWNYSSLFGKA